MKISKIFLLLLLGFVFGTPDAPALDGTWRGDLSVNSMKLPLVFHFSSDGQGETQCSMDSPMQGAKGIVTEVTYCDGDSVAVAIKSIGAFFSGKMVDDEIAGTFSQRGYRFPLVLNREKSEFERRPQTPRGPFPYASIDTTFVAADGKRLAGTLTLPEIAAPGAPAVVLITGSGPQNRDEELFEHRPFAVIADFLARNGIASLRYDDRGVGQSEGTFGSADIETFKSDAAEAVAFLRSSGGFGKVGAIGHSEGGTITLMLASEGVVDFAVSLAGATVRGKELILAQNRRAINRLPLTTVQKADVLSLISKIFDDIIDGKGFSPAAAEAYSEEHHLEIPDFLMASLQRNVASADSRYYKQLLSLDPSEWLGRIGGPVLGLNGSIDTQVESGPNLEALRRHVKGATVKEYEGLNHLFQHATTGDVAEYSEIRETISPEVLTDMLQFIVELR